MNSEEEKQKLITKINKIHALAINNPNIDEGISAMRIYDKLMKDNNLTEYDLKVHDEISSYINIIESEKQIFIDKYINVFDRFNDIIIIDLPNDKNIIFEKEYVEYKDTKIYYNDMEGIQYNAVNYSINLIPTSQSKYFKIYGNMCDISLDLSSTFYIKEKSRKETWQKLIWISQNFIEPLLIKQKLKRIFDEDISLTVDNFIIEKEQFGYIKNKFWGGKEKIYSLWQDNKIIYYPQIEDGNVVIMKDNKGEPEIFTKISLEYENSIIIPEMFKACKRWHSLQNGIIMEWS